MNRFRTGAAVWGGRPRLTGCSIPRTLGVVSIKVDLAALDAALSDFGYAYLLTTGATSDRTRSR